MAKFYIESYIYDSKTLEKHNNVIIKKIDDLDLTKLFNIDIFCAGSLKKEVLNKLREAYPKVTEKHNAISIAQIIKGNVTYVDVIYSNKELYEIALSTAKKNTIKNKKYYTIDKKNDEFQEVKRKITMIINSKNPQQLDEICFENSSLKHYIERCWKFPDSYGFITDETIMDVYKELENYKTVRGIFAKEQRKFKPKYRSNTYYSLQKATTMYGEIKKKKTKPQKPEDVKKQIILYGKAWETSKKEELGIPENFDYETFLYNKEHDEYLSPEEVEMMNPEEDTFNELIRKF